MMKKVVKIVLVLIMLLGIAFSLSNFITLELKASPNKAAWYYANGVIECMGQGNECDPFAYLPN
jgi:hypothetical protein